MRFDGPRNALRRPAVIRLGALSWLALALQDAHINSRVRPDLLLKVLEHADAEVLRAWRLFGCRRPAAAARHHVPVLQSRRMADKPQTLETPGEYETETWTACGDLTVLISACGKGHTRQCLGRAVRRSLLVDS